jgi:hypothetical protein
MPLGTLKFCGDETGFSRCLIDDPAAKARNSQSLGQRAEIRVEACLQACRNFVTGKSGFGRCLINPAECSRWKGLAES